ncbi:MAG: hypothetical protein ACI7YS_18380 [Flavobacterium sp.]
MATTINCSSCGASNQLPEGKNSMFCAFCGSSIQKAIPVKNDSLNIESSIRFKPEISKKSEESVAGKLYLINRNIKTLEIIVWFSDNELSKIKYLNLSKNELISLRGLNRFRSATWIGLSNNKLENLEGFQTSNTKLDLERLDLSNNNIKSLVGISKFSFNARGASHKIDLSNNDILYFDDFPYSIKEWGMEIILTNNKNLIGFTEDVVRKIANLKNK